MRDARGEIHNGIQPVMPIYTMQTGDAYSVTV